jgi:uncharacterized membrane protein
VLFLLFFGRLFWLIIPLLLIWCLVHAFGSRFRQIPSYQFHAPSQFGAAPIGLSALDILRQRYARGEIDAATYENMRERLENTGRSEK